MSVTLAGGSFVARARRFAGPALAQALWLVMIGCGGSLPAPPTGPHVDEVPSPVPYPPPPGRVEVIPPAPVALKHPVWIDGEWQWRSHRWSWQQGQWLELPAGSYYAPPAAVRLADGTLVYFQGSWKLAKKR